MRKAVIYPLSILILVLFSVYADNNKAPDFKLKDLSGNDVSLSDFKGKIVILNFWATWCGPCIHEMPALEKLFKKYKDKGVQLLGLTIASKKAQIPQKVTQTGVTYPILVDADEVVPGYGNFNSIPQTFIIDREGNIIKQITGGRDYAAFEKEVKELLK